MKKKKTQQVAYWGALVIPSDLEDPASHISHHSTLGSRVMNKKTQEVAYRRALSVRAFTLPHSKVRVNLEGCHHYRFYQLAADNLPISPIN